jgi:hypothetical protein
LTTNPEELKWFDSLRVLYDFPLIWHGRGWLDDQMATFPDVRRYYLEDAQHAVVELLRELNAEEAVLAGGVADAIARLDRLRSRLNDLDPQYRIELLPGPAEAAMVAFPEAVGYSQRLGEHGPVTLAVIPKYRDALRDRPILVRTQLRFPDTEVGQQAADQIRSFLDFGEPTEVKSEYVDNVEIEGLPGLGGQIGPGTLRVGPAPEPFVLDAQLRVTDEAGERPISLPLRFTERRGGQRGHVISGQDATGIVQISIQFDESAKQVKVDVRVKPAHGKLPASLLHPLRFAHALRSPHRFTATIAGQALWNDPQPLPDLALVPTEYLTLIEDLARIQAETNTPFSLPDQIEAEDIAAVARLTRLLDGEAISVVPNPITFTPQPDTPPLWLTNKDEPGFLALEAQCRQPLMGEEIPLGTCNIIMRGPWEVEELPDSQVQLTPTDRRGVLRRGSLPRDEQDNPH